jgi:two-component system sensor histidine kinase/response regulator
MLPPALRSSLIELGVSVPECRRVLAVDDELGNLEVLEALLEDDWEVYTAGSGDEALQLLTREGAMDLVIADQRMPGMTGVELLGEVARRHPSTIRIVLTGFTDVEPMLAAANLGLVYRFLFKPFDPMEMRAIVADAMRLKTYAVTLLTLVTTLAQRREELQKGQRELQQARENLLAEERLATLGQLVAEMTGELRSRSAALNLLLGLVRQTMDDPGVLGAAEAAWSGLSELRELLQQVTDYTKATSASSTRETVDPRAFLGRTMERFLMEDLGHRCPVLAHHDPRISELWVDRTRLEQALLALLRNAVRASEPDEAIHLGVATSERGEIVLEIRDRGCGMSDAQLARAREPFYSGFPSPGIGLGLEIAELAAKAHQGRLELHSVPGEGTTARLILPATAEEPREA